MIAGTGYSVYHWNNGDNTDTTQVSHGIYAVTVTDGHGCVGSDSAVVAVSPPPVPVIVGPSTVCSGTAATLSTSVNYTSYLWSNSDTTSTIDVNTSGSYNVTVSLNGCVGSSTTPYIYTPTSLPVEYVSQFETGGATSSLQVSPRGASYQWLEQTTPGGQYVADTNTTQQITVSCSRSTVYYTAIVSQNGCNDTGPHWVLFAPVLMIFQRWVIFQ